MVGGVVVDWLEREWLRGTRGYERFSITLPLSPTAILDMFATDMSNHVPSSLYPKVVGQHSRALYTLDYAVGTITQMDTRTFNQSFNKMGPYPSAQQVCIDHRALKDC